MKHSVIRSLLYEYLLDELDEAAYDVVRQHLSTCKTCPEELDELRKALAVLPRPSSRPHDERDEAFWQSLAVNIEGEIRRQRFRKPGRMATLAGQIRSFFTLRQGYAFALGGALAAIALAVFVFRPQADSPLQVADNQAVTEAQIFPTANESQQRISDYFRKSKILLVGIANLKTDDEQNVDLSNEKSLSRSLVREARFLQQQPLDGRSSRLIRDLEKIMIELANLEETNDLPDVELIRSGIRQENLLFKIRMAAASYDTNQSKRYY